jgi:CheY-like chemotaxis protein
VLRNLLSNAVKFTDHGGVTLTIAPKAGVGEGHGAGDGAGDGADGTAMVEFAVTDTGIGISEDKLQVIFEAFQQADGTTSREFGGTGLGLSISKELTRLLGAELTVESEPGKGSTFALMLPVEPANGEVEVRGGPEAAVAAEAAALSGVSGGILSGVSGGSARLLPAQVGAPETRSETEPRTVVLVAESSQRRILHTAAESAVEGLAGIKGRIGIVPVRVAADTAEALAGTKPVCVLIDLDLPPEELEGVLNAVCADTSAPVLLYESAAHDGRGDWLRAEYAGRCQAETVRSANQVVERLTLHLLTGMPRAGAATPENSENERELPRFDGEKVLVVDDDIRNVFALTSALELQGLTVVYAGNGREGIELLDQHQDIALVLMDIMMPGMDGYATTARIRQLERFRDVPIIAVTAKAMKGDREKSLAAGTNEHVTKPVDVGELLVMIRAMISR